MKLNENLNDRDKPIIVKMTTKGTEAANDGTISAVEFLH